MCGHIPCMQMALTNRKLVVGPGHAPSLSKNMVVGHQLHEFSWDPSSPVTLSLAGLLTQVRLHSLGDSWPTPEKIWVIDHTCATSLMLGTYGPQLALMSSCIFWSLLCFILVSCSSTHGCEGVSQVLCSHVAGDWGDELTFSSLEIHLLITSLHHNIMAACTIFLLKKGTFLEIRHMWCSDLVHETPSQASVWQHLQWKAVWWSGCSMQTSSRREDSSTQHTPAPCYCH